MATQARKIASVIAEVIVLALITAAFFVRIPQVSGPSMEPRIQPGEVVLINTLAYRFGKPVRGQIIAFRHDAPTPETYIKRVVGLGGDRIAITRGVVSVNGTPLDEPYVRFRNPQTLPPLVVPADGIYVLGDNRSDSDDSRDFGPLALHDIIGQAVVALWPVQGLSAP
ncbi:MAG: signal peptidase I [Candidatus Velthaea sp.]